MPVRRPDMALPEEVAGPRTVRGLEITGLTAVVVVILVNFAFVVYFRVSPLRSDADISAEKWESLSELDGEQDWLIVGDSTCLVGLDPQIIERDLGGSATNLCTFYDLLAVDDSWMIQRYIKLYGAPDNVIMVHAYSGWAAGLASLRTSVLAQIPLDGPFWEEFSPQIDVGADASLLRMGRLVPLWFSNESIGRLVRDPVELLTVRGGESVGGGIRPIPDADQRRLDETLDSWRTRVNLFADGGGAPLLSDLNRASLEEIVRLADEYSFDVYIVSPPLPDVLADDPLVRNYLDAIAEELDLATGGLPGVHVLVGDPIEFEADEMWDAAHVLSTAVQDYSERVAAAISGASDERSDVSD